MEQPFPTHSGALVMVALSALSALIVVFYGTPCARVVVIAISIAM